MNKLIVSAVVSLTPFLANAQSFPTNTVSVNSTNQINVADLTEDTFFVIDATRGFGGFILPDPSVVGVRSFGAVKNDHTSNLISFFVLEGSISGFNFLTLTFNGDHLIIGCDGEKYFVMSQGRAVNQQFHEHRTILVSAGQSPRVVSESDRGAILRIVADTGPGTVVLPIRSNFVDPNNYRNNFTVTIQRTINSNYPVYVCPPDGSALNSSLDCFEMTEANEFVIVDCDSLEFFIVSHTKPSLH